MKEINSVTIKNLLISRSHKKIEFIKEKKNLLEILLEKIKMRKL